jgi:hypothetical protein
MNSAPNITCTACGSVYKRVRNKWSWREQANERSCDVCGQLIARWVPSIRRPVFHLVGQTDLQWAAPLHEYPDDRAATQLIPVIACYIILCATMLILVLNR